MSTFAVTIEPIRAILPIDGADAIELAQVALFTSVVPKGAYSPGELILYIPEAAILPDGLIAEIGLQGRLAGSEKNRVKAVRLRGALSQGIVCRPQVLVDAGVFVPEKIGANFAKALGISKWVPEVPTHMSGDAYPCAEFLRWVDIENIKKYPDVFADDEIVDVTEKIHGTCFVSTYIPETDTLHVSSKGMSAKGLALVESDSNVYWKMAHLCGVKDFLQKVADHAALCGNTSTSFALYGEVFGRGIQDLHYGTSEPTFRAFDLRAGENGWASYGSMQEMWAMFKPGFDLVPLLYNGPFNMDLIWGLASGNETVSGSEGNIREGVVVRPQVERHSDVLGGRAIAKFVSDDYLTRKNKGATEFE